MALLNLQSSLWPVNDYIMPVQNKLTGSGNLFDVIHTGGGGENLLQNLADLLLYYHTIQVHRCSMGWKIYPGQGVCFEKTHLFFFFKKSPV